MGRISLEITAVLLTVVTLHLKATSSSSAIKSTEQTVNNLNLQQKHGVGIILDM